MGLLGRSPRTVTGRTDDVVIVGAGLAGLSCALRLAGAGRNVTILERESVPGGRAGLIDDQGFRFDTGPTVLTMPDLIRDAFDAVGEDMDDWLDLVPVEPLYRAYYPDGSQLDVHSDVDAMAAEIERVISPGRGRGLPPLRRLRLEALPLRDARLHRHATSTRRSTCSPRTSPSSSPSAASASSRRRCVSTSTTRAPSGCSASRRCTPASPRRTRSPSTRSSPTWTPSPGSTSRRAACTRCRAPWPGAAEKHGVTIRYSHRGHARGARGLARRGRAHGRRRAHRCRRRRAQPGPPGRLQGAARPRALVGAATHLLAVVLPAARRLDRDVLQDAHHNIHFGRSWNGVFRELIDEKRLHDRPERPGHQPDLLRPVARSRRQADLLRAVPDPEPRRRHRLAHRGPALPRRGGAHARGARLRRLRRRHRGRARDDAARLGGARASSAAPRSPPRTPSGRPGRSGRRTCGATTSCSPARAPSPASGCRWCWSPGGSPPSASPGSTRRTHRPTCTDVRLSVAATSERRGSPHRDRFVVGLPAAALVPS